MKKLIILLTLALSTLNAQGMQKVSIQLHWKYQYQFAGFIMAKEKGYYSDVGLNVELKEYQFGMDIIDEVLTHKSNYGIYNSNILISYLQNKSIKLVSSYFKRSALVLVATPNIKSPKDLIGKSIMAGTEEDFNLNFKALLDEYDVDIKKLTLIPHTYSIDDFVNSKVDVMTAFISDQPYKLDKLGIKYNIINPSDYGTFNLQLELFTSKTEVENHPKRVEKFRNATLKGWKYALSHEDETIKLIHEKYAKDIDIDSLKNEAKEIRRLILPKTYEIGSIDVNFLNKQFEIFKSTYKIENERLLDSFIFNYQNEKNILTPEQKNYVQSLQAINICLKNTYTPFTIKNENKYTGISVDYLKLISQKTKLQFNFLDNDESKCDLMPFVVSEPNTFETLKLTKPYLKDNILLVTKIKEPYLIDLNNLKDEKIMILKSAKNLIAYVKTIYPNMNLIEVDNTDVSRVVKDEFYGYIASAYHISYEISSLYLNELKVMFKVGENKVEVSFALFKQADPILLDILNIGISSVTTKEYSQIIKPWVEIKIENKTDYTLVLQLLAFFLLLLVIFSIIYIKQKKLHNKIKDLNETLEARVQYEVKKNREKDKQILQQSRLAQMGEMISMIAHQWRQPLSAISATSTAIILKAKLNKLDKELTIDLAEKISQYSEHLGSTIDDFRNFFKPNKNKKDIIYNQLIEDVLKIVEVSIKNKNITIIQNLNSTHVFHTYSNELKQVILNLLKNAEDILLEKGLENPTITIATSGRILTISDNGGGIPEDIIENIFDPYFSTKLEKNGTGLGLYMSKIIILEHCDGKLSVTNGADGAVFTIEL